MVDQKRQDHIIPVCPYISQANLVMESCTKYLQVYIEARPMTFITYFCCEAYEDQWSKARCVLYLKEDSYICCQAPDQIFRAEPSGEP